jgi:glutaredoxin
MDPLARRVLEIFNEPGRDALVLPAIVERIALPAVGGATEAVRAALMQLVHQGFLREAGERFARTEEGRLALAGPLEVTLYTRPGCHLCEEAKAQMAPLLREFGATLREVNIDADPELRERYTRDVPVVFLGARKVAKHRVTIEQFRRQLKEASA